MTKIILFVGDLNFYSKGSSRNDAIKEIGYEPILIPHTPIGGSKLGYIQRSLLFRLAWKLGLHLDTENVNNKLASVLQRIKPDLLWVEKEI